MIGDSERAKESLEQAKVIAHQINGGVTSDIEKLILRQTLSPKSPKDSYDSSSPVLVAKEVSEEQRQQLKTKADMLLEQGDLDETQSVYDEALTAYNDALEIYSTLEDAQGIIKVYLRFASIHYHVGKIELSRKVCSDALALAEANRLPISKRMYWFNL